tara:strand:- start:134 stop:904 length:771 start_codon:yes stop_codon:yes gene_type:complete
MDNVAKVKTNWDYSRLAYAYVKRPDYSSQAIEKIYDITNSKPGQKVCDVGAGVGHLTLHHAKRGLDIVAIEPNDEMRTIGIKRTEPFNNVVWYEAKGEDTKQSSRSFDLVTFGSSFNVTDRQLALKETSRILKHGGWFVCVWNHRILDDPIQKNIEDIIKTKLVDYNYGSRREDQAKVIEESGLFDKVEKVEGEMIHSQTVADCIEAWRSHATLERQAGCEFSVIINNIEDYLNSLHKESIHIPYITRAWVARKNG